MKKLLALLVIAVGVFAATVLHAQTTYYVQSMKAKVLSGKSFKSAVIAELVKGQKLAATGKEGSWIKVRYNNSDGYVSSLLLSTQPPMERTGVIKGDDAEINKGVRRRASSYTSAAAARGLAQDDRRRLSKEEKADYDSIDKIESYRVSPEELTKFMEGTRP